jgi:putative salt-induced outer membrane protein YdiY
MFKTYWIPFAAVAVLVLSIPLKAQTPSALPAGFSGSVSAGLALTGGNTSTNNFNLAFAVLRDLKTRNVVKANGLYLRGSQNDTLNVDRTSANLRDEYTLSGRTFLFGQTDYVRDKFKEINYLFAPTAGAGYKIVNNDNMLLLIDGGAGGYWEKNPGLPVKKSGSVTAGQRFSRKVSSSVSLTQSLASIWKMDDFSDSLSNFAAGVTTSVNNRLDIKLEFLDTFKNQPSRSGIKKNDTAFVTALVVKF